MSEAQERVTEASDASSDRRQLLVVANKTCPCAELHEEIDRRLAGADADVLVIAPALNSRLKHWVTDTGDAVAAAEKRLQVAVEDLERRGMDARGAVGDSDPLQAIDDAVHDFEPDEIMISTHPPGRSHWLEKRLIERVRERHAQPVTHVVSSYGLESSASE